MRCAVLILLTLSAVVSARVVQVSTDVYETVSPRARYVIQPAMTWGEAYKSCKKNDGHLIVINSQQEADDLVAMVGSETVFVGVHDKYIPGKYVTVTGEALGSTGYDQWYYGAPSGSSNNCIAHVSDDQTRGYLDVPCIVTLRSVCEQRLLTDYELIEPYGFYKMNLSRVTWQQARQGCRQDGAHLIVINSQAELDAVYREYLVHPFAWTAIHQSFYPGEFVTVFNDKLTGTGYSKWMVCNASPGYEFVTAYDNRGLNTAANGYVTEYFCEHEIVRS